MTVFSIHLLRLRGDERWADYGDDWWDHVERLGELQGIDGWSLLSLLGERPGREQLDWGAFMHPLSKTELVELYRTRASELAGGDEAQLQRLEALPEADYGLVVVEEA